MAAGGDSRGSFVERDSGSENIRRRSEKRAGKNTTVPSDYRTANWSAWQSLHVDAAAINCRMMG